MTADPPDDVPPIRYSRVRERGHAPPTGILFITHSRVALRPSKSSVHRCAGSHRGVSHDQRSRSSPPRRARSKRKVARVYHPPRGGLGLLEVPPAAPLGSTRNPPTAGQARKATPDSCPEST